MEKLGTIELSSDILTKANIGLWAFELDEGSEPRMYADEAMMKLIGLDLGPNRVPWRNMTDEEEAAMKAELEEIDFFNRCNIL